MKRNIQLIIAAVVVLVLIGMGTLFTKWQQTSKQFADAKLAEQSARTSYTDAINSIAEIQDSLNAIVLGDSAVGLVPSDYRGERALSESRGDEVLDKIAQLKAGLERTRARIVQLDETLKQNGVHITGLQHMIVNLKREAKDKETAIAQLTDQVNQLQTQVTGLTATVQEKDSSIAVQEQTIADKTKEIGTIYYVIGSKKDLTKNGVVAAKGGVLGMGKTLETSGKVDDALFTSLDTDVETIVTIPSAKAQVISSQPASSYNLVVNGKETELHILDPKSFRTVKHLVIVTA
jgi:nitrogen fixation-related uncharacterized protein